MNRVILCANQISLCLASELIKRKKANERIYILYDSLRCDVELYKHIVKSSFVINKYNFIIFYLYFFLVGLDELVVPHFKWRYAKFFKRIANITSYVDDGLDTFRVHPNNIDESLIKTKDLFYTFDYKTTFAYWLGPLNVIRLCSISNLGISNKKIYDFNQYENVVIESPGVESIFTESINTDRSILVRHSNPNKHVVKNYSGHLVLGSSISLEKSLLNYEGEIHVGESMVFVFLANAAMPKFNINFYLNEQNKTNYLPLLDLCQSMENVNVIISEG